MRYASHISSLMLLLVLAFVSRSLAQGPAKATNAIPKRAVRPKVPFLAAASFFAAVGLAILAAAVADVRSGRILEEWQLERELGLRLLGEVPRT